MYSNRPSNYQEFTLFSMGISPLNLPIRKENLPVYNMWSTPTISHDALFTDLSLNGHSSHTNHNSQISSSFVNTTQSHALSQIDHVIQPHASYASPNTTQRCTPHSKSRTQSSNSDEVVHSSDSASTTQSYSSSSSDPMSVDSADSDDNEMYRCPLPSMEPIIPYKRLKLAPSCFTHGCVCGHNFEFRDMACESRKHKPNRHSGVTIKPKIPPITAGLRTITCRNSTKAQ